MSIARQLSLMILLWLNCSGATACAQTYLVTDLGSLGGARGSGAYAHRGGVSAGYSFVPGPVLVHALVNDRGVVRDLGTLGGSQSLARGVNAGGDVVGWSYLAGSTTQRAFLWRGGVMQDLGTLGGSKGDAQDINDAGIIVGSASDSTDHERGFWWRDGAMHDIGTLGGSGSRVNAVNSFGEFTGWANIAGDDEIHAFLSKPGSPLYDLGTLGGPTSYGWGVNNQIHVCGWSELEANSPVSRGFLWADGLMKSLGTLGGIYSAAFGLNDLDEVVGASTRVSEVQAAFIWRQGQMYDLNTLIPEGSGWFLRAAWDIENDGAIVGEGVRPDGLARGFLLTPTSTAGVPVAGRDRLAFQGPNPNPITSETHFDLVLPVAQHVEVRICDVGGRARRKLTSGWLGAGRQRLVWDARDDAGVRLSPGVYWAQVATRSETVSRMITVVR